MKALATLLVVFWPFLAGIALTAIVLIKEVRRG